MSDSEHVTVELDATVEVDDPTAEGLLDRGEIEVLGRMPWSSNGTYLVTVSDGDARAQAIYKPEAHERPLWDFPAGLWRREVATYRTATALGWPVVPPTVARSGPFGPGSVQFFVPSHFEQHYFTIRADAKHRTDLHRLCVLDVIVNNTDRKGGHVLLSHTGSVWGIDHGLSFHEEFKLRTVMWDDAGEPIDAPLLDDVDRNIDAAIDAIGELLTPVEIEAAHRRALAVRTTGLFPRDPTGQRYPWPLV